MSLELVALVWKLCTLEHAFRDTMNGCSGTRDAARVLGRTLELRVRLSRVAGLLGKDMRIAMLVVDLSADSRMHWMLVCNFAKSLGFVAMRAV